MTPLIGIGAIAVGLFLICLLLRINAIFMFVAYGCGELLLHYIGDDAAVAMSGLIKGPSADVVAHLFLLWLPIVLCILFLRRSLPSSGIILQAIPLAFTAAAMALLTLTMLSQSFQDGFYATPVGHTIHNAQTLVIAGAGVTTFLLILIIGRPHNDDHKHKKHR
jgi:hypothetical protein